MPSYDPQRSRSRRRVADDEGPAPVDALLGPAPDAEPEPEPSPAAEPEPSPAAEPEPSPAAEPEPSPAQPLIVDLDQPVPVNVPRRGGRAVLVGLVLFSVVVQAAVLLWWRRHRAVRPTADR